MWHFLHAICFLTLLTHLLYLHVISGSWHYLPLPLRVRMVQQSPSGLVTFLGPCPALQPHSADSVAISGTSYLHALSQCKPHSVTCCPQVLQTVRVKRDISPCCWGAESFRVPLRSTCSVSGVLKAMRSFPPWGIRRKIAPEFLSLSFLTLAHYPRPSHSLLPECIWRQMMDVMTTVCLSAHKCAGWGKEIVCAVGIMALCYGLYVLFLVPVLIFQYIVYLFRDCLIPFYVCFRKSCSYCRG